MAADEVSGKVAAPDPSTATLERFESWLSASPGASGTPLGRGYQAVTELFRSPVGDFVVKTARGPWPWRRLGEAALRREHEVYRKLGGVDGVPRCLGLIDGARLVLEYVDGNTFRSAEPAIRDRSAFFERLLATLDELHRRGVAHGDLKRKDNLLVGPDQRPYIVDFGVASIERPSAGRWANAMFRWMRQYDYNAWVKLKYRRELEALSAADAALYRPTAAERCSRVVRVVWQTLTLRRLRRRIWPR